jgi:hypothetical protein
MGGQIVDAFEQGAVKFRVSWPLDPHLLPQVKLMAAPYRTVLMAACDPLLAKDSIGQKGEML